MVTAPTRPLFRMASALSALALGSCGSDAGPRYATEFLVVQVAPSTPAPLQLAVQACAGLANRRLGGSVFVESEPKDAQWLADLGLTPSSTVDATTYVNACVEEFPKCVRYSYATQQQLLPAILTAGAALGAVPLDVAGTVPCGKVAFDAVTALETRTTPDLATQYVADRFLTRTTGLAMLNPGYDPAPSNPRFPPITRDMPSTMVDLVYSKRLFTHFLVNGCIEMDPENDVLDGIVNSGQFETPMGVYGYNNSWLLAGYLYEAHTSCLPSHNMGAIPTETSNLSFFSTRRAPVVSAADLAAVPPEQVTYDPSKTYVAFVIGDGDNVAFVMTTRKAWMQERIATCAASPSSCAPLTWSLSPHLPELAPDVIEWYFETSRATGKDYFILPPSGHLYSYPTLMNDADQDRFVSETERAARILSTHSTVHWDLNGTWGDAETHFLPKYAHAGGVIQGIVPVNVPYLLPAFPNWDPADFYHVLVGTDGTPTVLFRPRQWRGIDDRDTQFFLSPQNMANEIAGYPAGTVTVIYTTSDGGLSLSNSFNQLSGLLPANVQLVSADAAAQLALAASGR